MERLKLRLKILGQYGSITKFAEAIGYGRQQLSNILAGRTTGSVEFWAEMQKKLNLTDAEVWRFQNIRRGDNEQDK